VNFQPRHRRKLFLLLALAVVGCCLGPGPAAARSPARSSLARRVDAILRQSEAQRGFWGIVVARLPGDQVLYTRNPDHFFQPASNMKLFTTAAALVRLGPNFVFRTTVESLHSPNAAGQVSDLYLVGRGDPNLSDRVLPYQSATERSGRADAVLSELAAQVRARGVREVTGDVVADDRYYLFEPYSHDWSEEDLQWGYGAPVTALAFNDNALVLHAAPGGGIGRKALVSLTPVADYYRLDNQLLTVPPFETEKVFVERQPGSMELDVWGQIPESKAPQEDTVSIENPPLLAGQLFRGALEDAGVKVDGAVRVLETPRIDAAGMDNPFAPGPARVVLAEHKSLPLADDITVILKVSQNLHAEMLLRTMAHELKGYGSLTVGLQVLREFTDQVGLLPDETFFADGCGLSRQALVTPDAVVRLLVYMAHTPQFQVFYNSLPVAGVDGTLTDRFLRSPLKGHVHAKTGSIEHVNTLSGYMDLPDGRRLAFSIMGNSHPMPSAQGVKVVDALAEAVYRAYGGRGRVRRRTRRR
jgi:serine-type D-Ala-D-Ala carboxypeptidase/endopeptidase (penicillin-binding protein 4)